MFIKKYLILLLTICITFICIQDSQSQSGRRLWGSDAYIEGDFQSNNIYAEDNISSTTGTFNVLEIDYPFDFKFYIQELQPIVRVGNSLFLDLADDLIIGNSQSIRFYPHVEGTKIDLFDNTYTIGLEPYTFIFETDEDFEFRTDEGNTIFKILADGTILSGSIITSSSVIIGDGYTLDFEQGTLGNKINLYGNSYNIGVIPYTLVLETDKNILMKNDTGKTLSYFSETEGMLTDKINSEILNVTGSAVITSVTAGVIDSTTASIQYINDATTDSTILYGHASQTVGSGVYSDISTLENIGIENLSSQGYPIGLALDVGSASTWYETDFVMGMFTCANLGKGICLAANGSHIFRSTDYGLTWSVVDDGLYVQYKAVCYLGNGVCLMSACDRGAIIFRSEDYGLTWSISSDEYTGYDSFKQIEYLGDGVCLAVGDNIIRSIDNGLTWSTVYEWVDLFSICNLGNGICLVSVDDYEGWMLRSEDYGQTWSLKGPYLSSLGVNYINSFAYLGNGICLAGTAGGGKILRSTDYGQTWSICTTFSEQNSIQSIVYLGNGICLTSGYSYGNTAAILRSTDYGLTWQDFGYHFGASSITSMCSIGDGICLAAKYPGDTLLRSTLTISASSWTLSGDSTDIYFNEGNVGIGTAAPTKKLHVEGDIDATTLSVTSLSATTGILSTANAQTLNVTGNATVNGFNYTASPTLNGASSTESTSTSVVGGIWNGDFSEGEGSSLYGAGYFKDNIYVSLYGGALSTLSIANNVLITDVTYTAGATSTTMVYIDGDAPIDPTNDYAISFKYKIENASTTYTSPKIWISLLAYNNSSYLASYTYITTTSNTDWTTFSTVQNIRDDANLAMVQIRVNEMNAKVYIDDIKLEQVTTHTNNSTTPTVAYPVITGVSSEFVDQRQTTITSDTAVGRNGDIQAQSYTPTEIKESAISFYYLGKVDGTPTGNLILEKRTDNSGVPSSTIIASVDIENSVVSAWSNGIKTIPIFSLNTIGTKYWITMKSDNPLEGTAYWNLGYNASDGYSGGSRAVSTDYGSSWTNYPSYDLYFKTHYAENTRQITLTNSSTGTSTTVDWGDDGLPDGAVVDLYNGTMTWSPLPASSMSTNNFSKFFNSISDISDGGGGLLSSIQSTTNFLFNGFWVRSDINKDIYGKSGYIILKIPSKYIKNAVVSVRYYSSGSTSSIQYSEDLSNWITLHSVDGLYNSLFTSTINNIHSNNIYVKLNPSQGGVFTWLCSSFYFTATLDTSAIAPLLLAAGSNTINQSVNGGSYKANVAIKSVSGGFQTTLNEANKQLTVLRNAPRSYLETPDKTQVVASTTNDATTYFNGQVSIGSYNPLADLHVEGDIYALGDMSAATFTDRTPAPPEDSLSQILKVSSKNGEIDHDTLGAAKVKRVQKISYVNVYSATDNSLIVKIPTTLNENIINITEEVPEQIIAATEAIEIVTKEVPVLYDLEITEVVKEITAPHSTVIKPEKIIKYKEKHYIKDMEKPLAVDDQYLEEDIYIDDAGDINFVVFPDAPAVETKDVVKKVTRTITLPSGEEIVETTTQEVIQLKPNVVQENDVYKIPSYTKVIGQRNLIKEKIEQEYNIPQGEIILQEQEVIEEVGNRDIGMSVSMSIRSIQQLYNLIETLTNRIKVIEENNK